MNKCEAGMDGVHEVYVQFPDRPNRILHPLAIQDEHGVDFTVEKVRQNLLQTHGYKNDRYRLAFRDEINQVTINVDQAHKIIEYLKYLTETTYTIIFVPL